LKRLLITLSSVLMLGGAARADLIISGVVDGTNTSGTPKGIELYALANIPDLSVYSIIRDTNGVGPFDTSAALPVVALNAGDFYYVAGNTASQTQLIGLGFAVGLVSSIANINGDDILGTSLTSDPLNSSNFIDSFGLEGQGDTNFYADSFAVRLNTSVGGQVPGLLDAGNFTITSYSDAGLMGAGGFGTYSPIPEPVTFALLGLGALLLHRLRRRP
jgi:hypothetical protein